jgi:hypothetical protein
MRKVTFVRFPSTGSRELFGRTISHLREQDGYEMRLHVESGLLLIKDPKSGGQEAAVHMSRVDSCYLADEPAPAPLHEQQQQARGPQGQQQPKK